MDDVIQNPSAGPNGTPMASEDLLPLVYQELRRLAEQRLVREKPGQTLQATALVHETYLRLVGQDQAPLWNSRGHFFAAAAEAMRRILVDRARNRRRVKRGGDKTRMNLAEIEIAVAAGTPDILALNEALERLAQEEPACAELVKLRYFAGMTQEESAQVLGVTRRTADRYWKFARAWLFETLGGDSDDPRDR